MFSIYFRDGLLLQAFKRRGSVPELYKTGERIEAAQFSRRTAVERLRDLRNMGCNCWLVPA